MRAAPVCSLAMALAALTPTAAAVAQVPPVISNLGTTGQPLVTDGLARMDDFDDAYGFGRHAGTGFVISARQGMARWMWYNGALPSNVRIEVSVSLVGGPTNTGFGLAFARPSREAREWMTFYVAGDGHYKLTGFDGSDAIPWRLSPAVQQGVGAQNRLAVEVRGRNVTLFLNGVMVDSYVADREVAGSLGAVLSQGVEVRFDDLRAYGIAGSTVPVPAASGAPAALETLVQSDFHETQPADDEFGRTEYADGGLLVTAHQGMVNWFWGRGVLPSHARITVTVTPRAGGLDGQFGIGFGRPSRDVRVWMALNIAADGTWQLDNYGGATAQPRTFTPALRPGFGVANELRVDLLGTTAAAYLNGVPVGNFVASREIAGYLGVHVAAGQQVLFQNLRVERLP